MKKKLRKLQQTEKKQPRRYGSGAGRKTEDPVEMSSPVKAGKGKYNRKKHQKGL